MNYGDFEVFAFANAGLLAAYWLIGFLTLFLLTRQQSGGLFFDPFHFYYAFSYGTSYGVVALLASKGYLDPEAVWIVFGFGIIFLASYRIFSKLTVINFNPLIKLMWLQPRLQRRSIVIMFLLYLTLAVTNISVSGFGFLAESRFDSTIGYGPIVRAMEPLRLFLTAWFGLKIVKSLQDNKSYLPQSVLLLLFILFSSLLNGAKFAFLEAFYSIAIATIVMKWKFKISLLRLYMSFGVLVVMVLAFVFLVLRYNISTTGGDPFSDSEFMVGVPYMVERFIGRIVWNGDMYFLSLPNEIYKNIEIDNTFIRFATSIFGSQIVGALVGYDVSRFEVGRLIWLHWSPNDEVVRGPTNHFDLTAYFYFGPAFGIFFVMLIALFLSQLNRLIFISKQSDEYRAIIISVLWCKSLGVLMHPAAGFAWFVDVLVILLFCKLASVVLFSPTPSTLPTCQR